jgi:hypothetical protein
MKQREIDRILSREQNSGDHSLRSHSMHRATTGQLPKTLTAHEWELWYAEHGIPQEHKPVVTEIKPARWWKKLANYLLPRQKQQ